MMNEILKDFVKIAEVNESLIQKYNELLPSEIITIWKEYGFGTFRNGYFKVINPDDYKALLESSYFIGNVSIPIFATAFGDLLIWQKNRFVSIVKYRYSDFDVITEGLEYFHETILDDELADEFYTFQKYEKAVNNIKKVKIKEHIALIAYLTGGV